MNTISHRVERPSLDLLPARMIDDESAAQRPRAALLGGARLPSEPRRARPAL